MTLILDEKNRKNLYKNIETSEEQKVTGFFECKVEFEDIHKNPILVENIEDEIRKVKEKIILNIKSGFEIITNSCSINYINSEIKKLSIYDNSQLTSKCENEKFFCEGCVLFRENSLELKFLEFRFEEDFVKFKIIFRRKSLLSLKKLLWLITLNKKKKTYFILNNDTLYRIYVNNITIRNIIKGNNTIEYNLEDKKLDFKKSLEILFENDENRMNEFLEKLSYKNILDNLSRKL